MNHIPTDDQIQQWAKDIRMSDKLWDEYVNDLLEMARRGRAGSTETDGFKAAHGLAGPGGGAVWMVENEQGEQEAVSVTSVEAMAVRKQQEDEMGKTLDLLFDLFSQEAASHRGARNTMKRALKLGTWERPAAHTFNPCCEPGCEDEAVKAGRCAADYLRKYRFERTHPGELAPPLTPEELERRAPRKRKRIA